MNLAQQPAGKYKKLDPTDVHDTQCISREAFERFSEFPCVPPIPGLDYIKRETASPSQVNNLDEHLFADGHGTGAVRGDLILMLSCRKCSTFWVKLES